MRSRIPRSLSGVTVVLCCALGATAPLPVKAEQQQNPGKLPLAEVQVSSPSGGLSATGSLTPRRPPRRCRSGVVQQTVARGRSLEARGTLKIEGSDRASCCGCDDDMIFTDGFENGDTLAWSTTVP